MSTRLSGRPSSAFGPDSAERSHPAAAPELQAAQSLRASKRSHRIMAWVALIAVILGAGGIGLVDLFLG